MGIAFRRDPSGRDRQNDRALPAALWVSLAFLVGCAEFPMAPGYDLVVVPDRGPLSREDARYSSVLQIRWLGTSCHVLQLGDSSILTDPFVTHHGFWKALLGFELDSDREAVEEVFGALEPPDAVFIGHSHWDHQLDLTSLLHLPGFADTPVYGSPTAHNLVRAEHEGLVAGTVDAGTTEWTAVPVPDAAQPRIEFRAWTAEHAPHFLGIRLYDGTVDEPVRPTDAGDFKKGEYHLYAFRLSGPESSFTVFFADAAFDARDLPDLPAGEVDVALLCVPGWKKVDGYPRELIQKLQPAHVVLSHYDNFFGRRGARDVVWDSDLEDFLLECQEAADYPGFRSIVVPDLDGTLLFP